MNTNKAFISVTRVEKNDNAKFVTDNCTGLAIQVLYSTCLVRLCIHSESSRKISR